jgi:hypothetical protein
MIGLSHNLFNHLQFPGLENGFMVSDTFELRMTYIIKPYSRYTGCEIN